MEISYFNFNRIRDEFRKIVDETWFIDCIKRIIDSTIPWSDVNSNWWNDFCRIKQDKKEELLNNLKNVQNFDQAYNFLSSFSLIELSPIEDPDKYIKYKNSKDYCEAYNDLLISRNDQLSVIERAKSKYDPEWYCYMDYCHIINGALTYQIMTKLYPNVKWYFYSARYHYFVSNISDISFLESSIPLSSLNSTTNVSEPLIADLYWFHCQYPINNLPMFDFTRFDNYDDIIDYLVKDLYFIK